MPGPEINGPLLHPCVKKLRQRVAGIIPSFGIAAISHASSKSVLDCDSNT